VVRLHPIGQSYSVIRTWRDDRFVGWYVNLEQPWQRTPIGFDSRDDVLDVVATDDLTAVTLKDEDELDFAVHVGHLSAREAAEIRRTAAMVRAEIANRHWPFDESGWNALRLPIGMPPVELPRQWDAP
jgi:predicted RNA-binding protein associated with RNAse of E/G family